MSVRALSYSIYLRGKFCSRFLFCRMYCQVACNSAMVTLVAPIRSSYKEIGVHTVKLWPVRSSSVISSLKNTAPPSVTEKLLKDDVLMWEDLRPVLEQFDADHILTSKKSLIFLRLFSRTPDVSAQERIRLAEDLMEKMRLLRVTICEDHYLRLLECYLKSKIINVESVLASMKADGVEASPPIKVLLLKCLSEEGKYEEVLKMAKELQQQGISDESVYSAIIYSYAASGNINKALAEWGNREKQEIKPGTETYISVLRTVILQGDENYFTELCSKLVKEEIQFSHDQALCLLESIVSSKNFDLLFKVAPLMDNKTIYAVMTNFLFIVMHSGCVDTAYSWLYNWLSKSDFMDNMDKWPLDNKILKFFTYVLIKKNYPAEDIIQKCLELRQLPQCKYALEHALYHYLHRKDLKSSLMVFKTMFDNDVPLETHYFWPLIIAMNEEFQHLGVMEILRRMTQWHVRLCPETLILFLFPMLPQQIRMNFVINTYLTCEKNFIIECFLKYALENGHFKQCRYEARKFLESDEKDLKFLEKSCWTALTKFQPNSDAVYVVNKTKALDAGKLIVHLWKVQDIDRLTSLVPLFQNEQMAIMDMQTVQPVLNDTKLSSDLKDGIKKLIQMDKMGQMSKMSKRTLEKQTSWQIYKEVEEAEVHLAELKLKKMSHRGQLIRLLKCYMKAQMFFEASKLKDKIRKMGAIPSELTPGLASTLFRLSIYEKDLKEALKHYHYLKTKYPTFKIDALKTISFAQLLAREGRYEDIIKVLNDLSGILGNLFSFEWKMSMLLRDVAECKSPELTDIVFTLLLRKGLIKPTTNTLQAFTKTYVAANDLDGAMAEYRRVLTLSEIESNTVGLLKVFVDADRLDLVDEMILLVKERPRYDFNATMALYFIAEKGDVNLFSRSLEKFEFTLERITYPFPKGCKCMPILKTLVTVCRSQEFSPKTFIKYAYDSISFNVDGEQAEDFLNYLEEESLWMESDKISELNKIISLSDVIGPYREEDAEEEMNLWE